MATTPATLGYRKIPGWYGESDRKVFSALLASQRDSAPGDLVEIGAYLGRSAVIIGDYLRPGEQFVVIDLFGDLSLLSESHEDHVNRAENTRSYNTLDRERFEQHYLTCHDQLPVVVQAPSTDILDHVKPDGARFIHVDASHMYAGVHADCVNTRTMLRPGGIAAFDDYRNSTFPGVGAAVWEAVFTDGLIPVATTGKKLYGVYDDPAPYLATLHAMVEAEPDWWIAEDHAALGHTILRLDPKPVPKPAAKPTARPAAAVPAAPATRRTPRQVVVEDLAPPALTRWVRRRRAAGR